MPAYIMGIVDELLDPEAMRHYVEQIAPLIAQHGGRYVFVSDKVQAIEGTCSRRCSPPSSSPTWIGSRPSGRPWTRPTSKPCGSAAPGAASFLSMRRMLPRAARSELRSIFSLVDRRERTLPTRSNEDTLSPITFDLITPHPRLVSSAPSASMSLVMPAAVTAAPAPGPTMVSGFAS